MLTTRLVTASLFALGTFAAMLHVSGCSADPGPESVATGAASEALTFHSCAAGYTWTCYPDEAVVGHPIPCGCEWTGAPVPTRIWDVVTHTDPTQCVRLSDNLPPPPELAGKGCLLGASQGRLIIEPVWACPADAGIPRSLTTTGYNASSLGPCSVSGGNVSAPNGTTDCAVVYTLTNSTSPGFPTTCFGDIADQTKWVMVWQHDWNDAGPSCESMGCGGPCPAKVGVIPH